MTVLKTATETLVEAPAVSAVCNGGKPLKPACEVGSLCNKEHTTAGTTVNKDEEAAGTAVIIENKADTTAADTIADVFEGDLQSAAEVIIDEAIKITVVLEKARTAGAEATIKDKSPTNVVLKQLPAGAADVIKEGLLPLMCKIKSLILHLK